MPRVAAQLLSSMQQPTGGITVNNNKITYPEHGKLVFSAGGGAGACKCRLCGTGPGYGIQKVDTSAD